MSRLVKPDPKTLIGLWRVADRPEIPILKIVDTGYGIVDPRLRVSCDRYEMRSHFLHSGINNWELTPNGPRTPEFNSELGEINYLNDSRFTLGDSVCEPFSQTFLGTLSARVAQGDKLITRVDPADPDTLIFLGHAENPAGLRIDTILGKLTRVPVHKEDDELAAERLRTKPLLEKEEDEMAGSWIAADPAATKLKIIHVAPHEPFSPSSPQYYYLMIPRADIYNYSLTKVRSSNDEYSLQFTGQVLLGSNATITLADLAPTDFGEIYQVTPQSEWSEWKLTLVRRDHNELRLRLELRHVWSRSKGIHLIREYVRKKD